MKPCYLIMLLVFSAIVSCKRQKENTGEENVPNWNTITIVSEENTQIVINSLSDTAIVNIFHAGSFSSPLPKNIKMKIDTIRVIYNAAERDTIFKFAKEIISNPPPRKFGCTDFVGQLAISIDYGGFTRGHNPGSFRQSIEYTGVCNWTILSAQTMQLHLILKQKLKKINFGEHDDGRSHTGN